VARPLTLLEAALELKHAWNSKLSTQLGQDKHEPVEHGISSSGLSALLGLAHSLGPGKSSHASN
jgi:hypothetical protein